MKYIFQFGIAIVLMACIQGCSGPNGPDLITIPADGIEPANDQVLSGARILTQSAAAYAQLRSYCGTTVVAGHTQWMDNSKLPYSAQAKVWFVRPRKLRIDGLDTNGNPFFVISDGTIVWTAWPHQNNGEFQREADLAGAVASWEGAAQGAATVIPGALVPINWGPQFHFGPRGELLPALATRARLTGQEDVNNHTCYRVVCEREIVTWALWVDTSSFLLRKAEITSNEIQWAAARKRGGGGMSGKICKSIRTEIYEIESINQDIDERFFRKN